MNLKSGVYNVEWMQDLFDREGISKSTDKELERGQDLHVTRATAPEQYSCQAPFS